MESACVVNGTDLAQYVFNHYWRDTALYRLDIISTKKINLKKFEVIYDEVERAQLDLTYGSIKNIAALEAKVAQLELIGGQA